MKRIRAIAASILASGALILGGLVPVGTASADTYVSYDVTRLSAGNLVMSDYECKNTDVRMTHRGTNADEWSVMAEVSRNGAVTSYADFGTDGDRSKTRVQVCIYSGFGKYTIGPSRVSVNTYDFSGYKSFTDYTRGSFYVRAKARTQLGAARHGRSVRLTARAQRYNPDKFGYTAYNLTARLQVKSGRHWKNLRTVRLHGGRAAVTVKSKAKRTYRVTFGQVSWATGATSRSVRR